VRLQIGGVKLCNRPQSIVYPDFVRPVSDRAVIAQAFRGHRYPQVQAPTRAGSGPFDQARASATQLDKAASERPTQPTADYMELIPITATRTSASIIANRAIKGQMGSGRGSNTIGGKGLVTNSAVSTSVGTLVNNRR
jgi:hypothetical protein